jgi:hypothetical protein
LFSFRKGEKKTNSLSLSSKQSNKRRALSLVQTSILFLLLLLEAVLSTAVVEARVAVVAAASAKVGVFRPSSLASSLASVSAPAPSAAAAAAAPNLPVGVVVIPFPVVPVVVVPVAAAAAAALVVPAAAAALLLVGEAPPLRGPHRVPGLGLLDSGRLELLDKLLELLLRGGDGGRGVLDRERRLGRLGLGGVVLGGAFLRLRRGGFGVAADLLLLLGLL